MNVLERVHWDSVSFQELDTLLHVSGFCVIEKELNNQLTPLCLACKYNREDLVTVLLFHGARTDKCSSFYGKLPLHFACDHSCRNLGLVRKLVEANAHVDAEDSDGNTGLHLACSVGNVPVVEFLLEQGANINLTDVDGETPLVRACFAKNPKLIDILLKAGSNPNVLQGQPLEIAVRTPSVETLKLLLDAGADLEEGAFMSHASEHNHIEMMKVLHFYGADVNKSNFHDMSPLHTACYLDESSPQAVKLLLQWGADVHAHSDSSFGETALHYSIATKNLDKIKLLLAYGADVNAQDCYMVPSLISPTVSPENIIIVHLIIHLLLAAGARLRPESLSTLRANVQNQDLLDILNFHASQPQNLQSLCRLTIRKSVLPNIDDKMNRLPLPQKMIRFLKFYDIVCTDTDEFG